MSEATFYTDRILLARTIGFLNPMCDQNPVFEWKGRTVGPTEAHALRDAIRAHLGDKLVEDIKPKLMEEAPPPEPILQFFDYDHLPEHLARVSMRFHNLASHIVSTLPRNQERTVALRKLLEAKDAAVRALLFKP